jgi:hypothetical protein
MELVPERVYLHRARVIGLTLPSGMRGLRGEGEGKAVRAKFRIRQIRVQRQFGVDAMIATGQR